MHRNRPATFFYLSSRPARAPYARSGAGIAERYRVHSESRYCKRVKRREICIVDTQVQPFDWLATGALRLFELRYLLLHINAKKNAHEDHANDDPHDTQRVSYGVGESRIARKRFIHIHSNQGLLASAKRGRIGRRSGEQARRRPKSDSEDFGENHCENSAPDHNRRRKAIQHQSLIPQRSEETGADLQADGEDEKDEPELPKKLHCVVLQVKAEVTKDQSREQDAGHAESNSANLDTRETQPNDGNQRNKKYRIRDRISRRVVFKPFHCGSCL